MDFLTKLKGKFVRDDYEIEIIEIKQLESNFEVFARSRKKGKQLGFGKHGTTDVERFRFFNLPEIVEDPSGDQEIIRKIDENDTIVRVRKDVAASLINHLFDTIRIVGKEDKTIVSGSVGNTTDTFFSDTGGTGTLEMTGNANYTTGHDQANADVVATATNDAGGTQNEIFGGNYLIMRMAMPFNTSSLPDSDTIDSATLSVFPQGTTRSGDGSSATIVSYTGGTNSIAASAYNKTNYGVTSGGATLLSSMSSGAYRDITLNATGLSYISKTGYTAIALRDSGDISSTVPSGINARLNLMNANDTNPPKLVIVHTAASGPANLKSYNTNLKANIKSINTNLIANVKSLDTNV